MVRKTHEAFVEEAKAINPNIEILGRYIGRHKRITVRCIKHDYIYNPFAHDVLRGHGCIYCRSEKMHDYFAMTQDEFEKEMYDINPNIKIIGKYIIIRKKFRYHYKPKACNFYSRKRRYNMYFWA